MTTIQTGQESFEITNQYGTYECAYNSVWIHCQGNACTILFNGRQRLSLVNDRFDSYTVDGVSFSSIEELEEALSKKLFKNPEGGGEGKGATVLKYENGQITLDGTPLTKAEIEELMAEQGLVVLSADAYGLQGVVCLPYLSEDGKLTFVGTVQSGGVDATIMYAMDDEDAVEGPTIVANETLSNKAESIIETYAEDQILKYPTIYAVLNFVYGQQYASVKVVSELPTDEETKGYFTDIYIKYEDGYYKAYKIVDGEWVVLNPKSTKKVVYNSESGTVSDTYANIKADLESGVHVYIDDNRGQFTYSQYLGESITFTRTSEEKVETVTVNSDGTAAYSSVEFSDLKGMTDDEARTVSEALNDLNGRIGEVEGNKATTMEGANDETYPTTKAVKDYVDSHGGGSNDWEGTQEQYDALTDEEKLAYDRFYITE